MAALNPTAITFDLSGISAQLSTTVGGTMGDIKTTLESGFATINQSITKLFEQLTSPQDKAEDKLDISGMREQILANVQVLWPALTQDTPSRMPEPTFYLTIRGTGTTIFGEVSYTYPRGPKGDGMKYRIFRGPDSPSLYQALKCLFGLTREMLNELGAKAIGKPAGWQQDAREGNSFYCFMRR